MAVVVELNSACGSKQGSRNIREEPFKGVMSEQKDGG